MIIISTITQASLFSSAFETWKVCSCMSWPCSCVGARSTSMITAKAQFEWLSCEAWHPHICKKNQLYKCHQCHIKATFHRRNTLCGGKGSSENSSIIKMESEKKAMLLGEQCHSLHPPHWAALNDWRNHDFTSEEIERKREREEERGWRKRSLLVVAAVRQRRGAEEWCGIRSWQSHRKALEQRKCQGESTKTNTRMHKC